MYYIAVLGGHHSPAHLRRSRAPVGAKRPRRPLPASYKAAPASHPDLAKAPYTTQRRYDDNGLTLTERVIELGGRLRYETNFIGGYDDEGKSSGFL